MTPRAIEGLREALNQDISLQVKLIREYMFTEMPFYAEEVESTTHILPLLTKPGGLRGMSGTIYNKDTYPSLFEEEPGQPPKFVRSDTAVDVAMRLKVCHRQVAR